MKLELEVLASASIKRKKPWPGLTFLGEVFESVFLLDSNRASVLYLPSGKTKKKIPKLHPILPDVVTMTHSDNGHFIVGLMRSGDMFLWHKDTDMLRFIPGVAELTRPTESHSPVGATGSHDKHGGGKDSGGSSGNDDSRYKIFMADDGTKILVLGLSQIFVWELDPNQELFTAGNNVVRGTWSRVTVPEGCDMPTSANMETSMHATFSIREPSCGLCCVVSVVFTRGSSFCVTTAVLSWADVQNVFAFRYPTYTVQWMMTVHPLMDLDPKARPIRCPGSYLAHHSHDSNLLAVAVNQLDTYVNKLAFVSVWTDTVVVTDMKGMGTRQPIRRNASSHWVVDLCWTPDDLFVACLTKQGSLCIVTRLGEPLMLQTFGCNIEMGPKPFLPLHPLISVSSPTADDGPQTESDALEAHQRKSRDPMRQRFSLSCHPNWPVLLVSDGYMVTALQLPTETTCLGLMRGLITESNRHLRQIRTQQRTQMTLFDSLKKQGIIGPKVNKKSGRANCRIGFQPQNDSSKRKASEQSLKKSAQLRYTFEEEEEDTALDTTQDSEIADFILASDVTVGKITFGDVDNLNATVDFARVAQEEELGVAEHILRAYKDLSFAWGLAVSHVGMWTSDHEDLAQNIIHSMVRLFACIMHCEHKVLKELNTLQGLKTHRKDRHVNLGFGKVLGLFKSVLRLLHLDSCSRHLMVCGFQLAHSMLELFLHNKYLHKKQSRLQTLYGGYTLLKYCDLILGKLYTNIPTTHQHRGLPNSHFKLPTSDQFTTGDLTRLVPTDVLQDYQPHHKHHHKQDKAASLEGEEHADADDGYSSQHSARSVKSAHIEQPVLTGAPVYCQKRLTPLWQLLHHHIAQHYESLARALENHPDTTEAPLHPENASPLTHQIQQALAVLQLAQAKVHSLGAELPGQRRVHLQTGKKLYLDGSAILAVNSWVHLLESIPDAKLCGGVGSRILHSMFYSLLLDDKLRQAIMLSELVIRQPELHKAVTICRQDEETKRSLLYLLKQVPNKGSQPIAMLTNKPSRQLVQSLARLMASFFSNSGLFVYPPHSARKIPPLHNDRQEKHRVIPLYPHKLSALVRQDDLGMVWTPERTLEYLMISGLYTEALWFVHKLGDWKAAFVMSVARQMHHKIVPTVYSSRKMALPDSLTAEQIIKSQLQAAFLPSSEAIDKGHYLLLDETADFDQLTRTLTDLLLAATVCEIDLVPWLLSGLLQRLKSLAQRFYTLVPEGLYLPAPPVYCPQPPVTSQEDMCEEALAELSLRRETSSVLLLLLVVLNSSRTTLPAASWYAQRVLDAFTRGMKLKKHHQEEEITLDIQVLQEGYLASVSRFQGQESSPSVHAVLEAFRDLCSVGWMFYARDQLSQALRHKARLSQQRMSDPESVKQADWDAHIRKTLEWTVYLLPFTSFLNSEVELQSILLSLILELPQTADTALILAEHFPDPELCDPEIQSKVEWILKEWQAAFIKPKMQKENGRDHHSVDSPRGVTMSVWYHSNIGRAEKIEKRRRRVFGKFEGQVFQDCLEERQREMNGITSIGSRHFESSEEYLQFLDIFYAVSFNGVVDSEGEMQGVGAKNLPLLISNSTELQEREFSASADESGVNQKRNFNKISIHLPRKSSTPSISSPRIATVTSNSATPPMKRNNRGLFRSRSLIELGGKDNQRTASQSPARNDGVSNKTDVSVKHMPPRSPRGKPSDAALDEELTIEDLSTKTSKGKKGILERSFSVSNLDDTEVKMPTSQTQIGDDPLASPVVPSWMLDSMKFESKFQPIKKTVDWVYRWASRNHTLFSDKNLNLDANVDGSPGSSGTKSAIRVRVPPNMVMYSLWLLENCFNPPPSVQNTLIPEEQRNIVVAVAQQATEQGEAATADKENKPKKSKKKKKHKSKKGKDQEAAEENVDGFYYQASGILRKKKTKQTSFRLPEQPPVGHESVGVASDGDTDTLSVSSLHDEELRRTMAETLNRLQSSLHVEDLEDGTITSHQEAPPSRPATFESMNSTLHFPRDRDSRGDSPRRGRKARDSPRRSRGTQAADDGQMLTGESTRFENGGSVAQELQGIVRQELRRIMQAQQQGILAMLGALDDPKEATDTMQLTGLSNGLSNGHTGNSHASTNGQAVRAKKSKSKSKGRDCIVMSVQSETRGALPIKRMPSTDAELSSLPSEGSEKVPSLSELEVAPKIAANNLGGRPNKRPDVMDLSGALRQLKLLEGTQDLPTFERGNVPQDPGHGQYDTHSDPEHEHQPFGRLITFLKDSINPDLTAVSWPLPGQPRLLSLPPEQPQAPSFHLPHIPRPAWEETAPAPYGPSDVNLPFAAASQPQAGYHLNDMLPERDSSNVRHTLPRPHPAMPNMPFPLLSLPQDATDGYPRQSSEVPRLIPPEEILLYEQNQYGQRPLRKREVQDFVRDQMSNQMVAQDRPEPIGKKLLIPEMFEPFAATDERDGKHRERRRKKKAADENKKATEPEREGRKPKEKKSPREKGKPRMGKPTRPKAKVKVAVTQDDDDTDGTLTAGNTDADSIVDEVASEIIQVAERSPQKSAKRVQIQSPEETSPKQKAQDGEKKLNHGFALTPGLFDEYLKVQDELGSLADNNARIQYRASLGVQTSPRKTLKQNVATDMTSPEKGVTVTRDTGTDPVADAIQDYYRAKTGHTSTILPPDVYLGLRYDDVGGTARSDGSGPGGSRAFLNVVDINADVLDDIVSPSTPRAEPHTDSAPGRARLTLPSQRAKQRELEKQLEMAGIEPDGTHIPGPDGLTADLLGLPVSKYDPVTTGDAIYSSRLVKTKDSIRHRLDNMNSQFSAIEAMSSQMERDLEHSNLLAHTIEQVGDALLAEQRRAPASSTPARRPISPELEVFRDFPGLKPSDVRRAKRQERRSPRKKGEKKEVMFQEPEPSPREDTEGADRTLEPVDQNQREQMELRRSIEDMDVTMSREDFSGLSGVSDILGEMIMRGDLDAREMGLTQKQAETLAEKALRSSREGMRLSHDDLEQIFKSPTEKKTKKRNEQESKKLQEWMSRKRGERQQEYKDRKTQLREAERAPFQPKEAFMSSTGIKSLHETGKSKRKEQEEEHVRRRQELAAELMGDILADHPSTPEDLPPRTARDPSPSATWTKKSGKGMEGKTVVRKISTTRSDVRPDTRSMRRPSSSPARQAKSPGHDVDRTRMPVDQYMQMQDSHDFDTGRVDSRTQVIKPKRFAERVPSSRVDDFTDPVQSRPLQPKQSPRAARQKSLAEMVRLQKPERTRQSRRDKPKPKTYTERLAEMRQEGSTDRSTGSRLRDQQRLYGSKHLPGSQRDSGRPRQVKTYAERLQDMKQSSPASVGYRHTAPAQASPPAPASRPTSARTPPTRQEITRQGITPRKPGKSLTYAEQLQQLQPPKELYRGNETITLHRDTSPKPTHKPQTYVEQLRDLQKPSSPRRDTYGPMDPKRYRTAPVRSLVRSRPYVDPYSEAEDDRLSVVSPWSVDEDVQRILYEDGGTPRRVASQPTTDIDMSELSDLDYFVGDDEYTAMVNVNDLADVGSVSDGSIMSFIDWDQVDQLIADGAIS